MELKTKYLYVAERNIWTPVVRHMSQTTFWLADNYAGSNCGLWKQEEAGRLWQGLRLVINKSMLLHPPSAYVKDGS